MYVAKFDINENELKGSGRWMELSFGKNGLTPENGFKDQAEVLIFARRAATQVGATTMDRPEWVAVHPDKSMCSVRSPTTKTVAKKVNLLVARIHARRITTGRSFVGCQHRVITPVMCSLGTST